jgi:hypothetical protein
MAKSLLLSTQLLTDEGKPRLTKTDLLHLQQETKAGTAPICDPGEVARLVAEKEKWDQTPDVSWARVILLILIIWSIPLALLGIALFIRHLR